MGLRKYARRRVGHRLYAQTFMFFAGISLVALYGVHKRGGAARFGIDLFGGDVEGPPEASSLLLEKGAPAHVHDLTQKQDAAPTPTPTHEFPRALEGDNLALFPFYILGMLYLFLGIAIVCDEFFVPALMVMCSEDYLNLSDDVAGATLMAAGGSAPELFTSYVGTFQKPPSPVGFGTIVGSAVFNVLFVIGMCAVFANEPLRLTWWPLFRDCCYYTVALVVLYIFFGATTKFEIHWYEALILFGLYFGYCALMKFHTKIYVYIMEKRFGDLWSVQEDSFCNMRFNNPSTFRTGIVKLLIQDKSIVETAGIRAVMQLKGDLEQTFKECDLRKTGELNFEDCSTMLAGLNQGIVPSEKETIAFMDLIRSFDRAEVRSGPETSPDGSKTQAHMIVNMDGTKGTATPGEVILSPTTKQSGVTYTQFKYWYIASEKRLSDEADSAFNEFDTNGDGMIGNDELQTMLKKLVGEAGTASDELTLLIADAKASHIGALDKNKDGSITKEEFLAWYKDSLFWTRAREMQEDDEEDGDPISIEWPDYKDVGLRGYIFFFVTLPIIAAFMITIPDVRRVDDTFHGVPFPKLCWVSFATSIAWIALLSYFMVTWAEVIGDTCSVPIEVMGLTVLAAGTSVPDLLSSVIVAKQGKGDMAVSSSIGSNIFDITVGLPLPWLSYMAVYEHDRISVEAESLEFSLLVLILMLIIVVLVVQANSWVMSKVMGFSMFGLYCVFVSQDVIYNFHCTKSYFKGCT